MKITVEVTLQLSKNLIAHAKRLGSATQRDLDTVLREALEMFWLPVEELSRAEARSPISALSDEAVMVLADSLVSKF